MSDIPRGRLANVDNFDLLAILVERLTAPHEDHCGSECMGGRHDCCSACALLDALAPALREANGQEKNAAYPNPAPRRLPVAPA